MGRFLRIGYVWESEQKEIAKRPELAKELKAFNKAFDDLQTAIQNNRPKTCADDHHCSYPNCTCK